MRKLYYEDSDIKTFQATVIRCTQDSPDGRWQITLDQTAFYPEGGGQPYDQGTLGGVKVLEVHEKDGEVVHTTDGPLPPGAVVEGMIDWNRRFQYMQSHTGEHMFTGIIHRRFGWDNVGFHMGADEVTVDFNGVVTPEQAREVEAEANRLVYANVPVDITYPTEEELKQIDYRSKKELSGQVRIVSIPGGDVCACCGTHVKRTGEVGLIKVIGMIRYKGGVRISLLFGAEALADYGRRQDQAVAISHLLSVRIDDVAEAVEKLKHESEEKDAAVSRLYQRIFTARMETLPESSRPLCLFEEGLSPTQIRQFCTMLYEHKRGSVVAVCSETAAEMDANAGENANVWQYALGSGSVDMRALSKRLNECLSGRGGGSALMAQGVWNATREEIQDAIDASPSLY